MASATGANAAITRLLNAQNESFLDKGMLPLFSADRPRNYRFVDMFLQARGARHTVSAMTDIVTYINPEIESNGGPKAMGAPHRTATGGDVVPMRTALTEYEWPMNIGWHQLKGNVGDPLTADGSQKLWDIAEKANQDLIVGTVNMLEDHFIAPPNPDMFGGNGSGEYPVKSLATGCNVWTTDHYDGTGDAGSGGDGLYPGMTDQQGLNPNDARFARADGLGGATQLSATKISYSQAANNATTDGHLLDRMGILIDLLKWEPTPVAGKYGPGLSITPRVIVCSREAKSLFDRTNRAHGELFATISPVGDPSQASSTYAGIPMMTSDSLRNAKLYPDVQRATSLDVDGAANRYIAAGYEGVTEFDPEGTPGGYYYFFDPEASNLYMHKDRAFEVGPWKNLDQLNEDLYRRLIKMIGNVHHSRFITHGILHPSAAISGYSEAA